MIHKERLLAEFFELVQIPCPTRRERQAADLLKARLEKMGFAVTEDAVGEKIGGDCGNIVGYLKGDRPGAPVLLLTAHMDCVEPCANIKPRLKDGKIVSDGATVLGADDKAGVAAILEAVRTVREQNITHGDIQVVFTVAEEGGLNGSKNMDPALLKADFGYALDSSGRPGKIIVKAPGQNKLFVKLHGKPAHAGLAPEEGVNAIVVAGQACAAVRQGRIDEETTANIGVIQGGRATNIVPELVEIICEARSRNPDKLRRQTAHMKETFEQIAAANGAAAEVKIEESYGPYVLDEHSPVIRIARAAARSCGLTPSLESTGGGSDANFYNAYGVPCSVLGVGMQKAHTLEEYILEEDLYAAAALTVELIKHAALAK